MATHQFLRNQQWQYSVILKKHLMKNLEDNSVNSSVTEIAKELGYDRRVITRKFPKICSKISQKYIANKKQNSQKMIQAYCVKVESVARKLYAQGIYPSEVVVSKHLDRPGYFRYKKVRNVLKSFQDSLI